MQDVGPFAGQVTLARGRRPRPRGAGRLAARDLVLPALRAPPAAPAAALACRRAGRLDSGPCPHLRRLVVLVSGAGTNLQALLDAAADPAYGARVVAVGADRHDIEGLRRAERSGVETFVHRVADYPSRAEWDVALAATVASYAPDLVVCAGFMKLVGPAFLAEHGGQDAQHPPGPVAVVPRHARAGRRADVRQKVTGCTLFVVDGGVDTGPIVDQRAVRVQDDDTVETLHERIKTEERRDARRGRGPDGARRGSTVEGRRVCDPRRHCLVCRHTTGAGGPPPGSERQGHRPPGCPQSATAQECACP